MWSADYKLQHHKHGKEGGEEQFEVEIGSPAILCLNLDFVPYLLCNLGLVT